MAAKKKVFVDETMPEQGLARILGDDRAARDVPLSRLPKLTKEGQTAELADVDHLGRLMGKPPAVLPNPDNGSEELRRKLGASDPGGDIDLADPKSAEGQDRKDISKKLADFFRMRGSRK